MGWITWIIFGALAGWIASMIMKTNAQMGAIANIVVGIVGSLIGGFVANLLGMDGVTKFNIYSLLIAIVGSCILIWLVGMFRKRA
ncbi:MAG: GlsB/YeaQ/YmgE family stress response membrane protein [Tissierellia bacterium]|nr:GlsB/YeaQ/YmgE family stress response membrane protein [Tissierellia bacterium]